MSSRPTIREVGGTQNTETAHNVTTDNKAAASTDDGMGGPGSRRGLSSNQDATLSSSRLRSGIPVCLHFRGPSRTLNALDAALLFIVPSFLFLARRLDLMYVGGYVLLPLPLPLPQLQVERRGTRGKRKRASHGAGNEISSIKSES